MFGFFRKKRLPEPAAAIENTEVEEFDDITPVADSFKQMTGVTFEKQLSILQNKVTTFCRKHEIKSFTRLLQAIEEDPDLKQELIDYLTTNETYFYREFKQIESLVSLVKGCHHHVDILCAPCSTGEEPYSIAIALFEAGIGKERFTITGIDINAEAIQKSLDARYRERNVRNLSAEILGKYFTYSDGHYDLNSTIKSQVKFYQMNLFEPSIRRLGTFDFIFSRNMLIYFDKETKEKAKHILEGLRKDPVQPVFFGHADLF